MPGKIKEQIDLQQLDSLQHFVEEGRKSQEIWFPNSPNLVLFNLLKQALSNLETFLKEEQKEENLSKHG